MKVIVHDLGEKYRAILSSKCDILINADGKYAPCQGCFGCWTKRPAECYMKDRLQYISRVFGQADELVIITENCYGAYSPAVKNVIDRSIGTSTPMSTYRGKQMKHTIRYGMKEMFRVCVYGDITDAEKAAFEYMLERNTYNEGRKNHELIIIDDIEKIGETVL